MDNSDEIEIDLAEVVAALSQQIKQVRQETARLTRWLREEGYLDDEDQEEDD